MSLIDVVAQEVLPLPTETEVIIMSFSLALIVSNLAGRRRSRT
jgi:hypothetical protein